MDRLLKKFAQKYKRAKEEIDKWDNVQAEFVNIFGNAVAILERLPILMDSSNYGSLKELEGMVNDLPAKQLESLENLFAALHRTLNDFKKIRDALERLWHESSQFLKAEKLQSSSSQAQQRFGLGPSLNECIEGLGNLYTMHKDEYDLKVASVNCFSYNTSAADMVSVQNVLADQPSIPQDEVMLWQFGSFSTSSMPDLRFKHLHGIQSSNKTMAFGAQLRASRRSNGSVLSWNYRRPEH